MSFEEIRIIVIVYASALLPIILIYLKRKDALSSSMIRIYILCFLLCSLGWEPVANFYDKLNEIIKYELSKKKSLDVNNYLNELIHK